MPTALDLIRDFRTDVVGMRAALTEGRIDEGLALARKYDGFFAKDIELQYLHGQFAYRKSEFEEAKESLARVLALNPHHGPATALMALSLARTGRRGEAVALIEAHLAEHPEDNATLDHFAEMLMGERGLKGAIATLKGVFARRGAKGIHIGALESLRQKALSLFDTDAIREADPDDFLRMNATDTSQNYALRSIYEQFEPLGCNCEFGFVQRSTGAESLALMRWTAIKPENLLRLLKVDLEGYDRPEIYRLGGTPQMEYMLQEDVYGTSSHTGVNSGDLPPEEFLSRVTRRQGFLKRKFLADAAEGRKIFVYKADHLLTPEDMDALESELRRLGVRRLLFVMPDPARAGTVEIASASRVLGYLSAVHPNIQYAEWHRIAVATFDIFKKAGEIAAAA